MFGSTNDDFAIGIVADNWHEYKNNFKLLKEINVIVITHERYYRIFYDKELLKLMQENRDVLILDEQPKEPIFTFSQQLYKEILSKVPGELLLDKKFADICQPIFNAINLMKSKTDNVTTIKLVNKKELKGDFELINEFKKILTNRDNITELTENNLYVDNILEFIKGVETIYNNQCIYSNKRISSFDREYWFWTLKNNIILDANAFMLDKKYYCNKSFDRYNQYRIKDYSNSTFYYIDINTSKTKISTYKNYYDKVIEFIKDNIKLDDKILLVTQKKELEMLNEKLEEYEILKQDSYKLSITWFGNIVGRNDWRDYNKIYIIASPNIPLELHILQYAFWSRKRISSQMDFSTVTIDKIFQFNNKELEKIRSGFIASEIYQALARINRDVDLDAEYYLLYNNEEIFDMVIKNFKNCKVNKKIKLDVSTKEEKETTIKKKEGDILYEHLLTLNKGIYKKKDIVSKLEISSPNLNKHLNYYKILGLIDEGKITIKHHAIEVHY